MNFSLIIQGTPCDLWDDESIRLSRQIKSFRDLTSVFTDFTQEFEIPSTPTNDIIFQDYFEENAVLTGWNPFLKKDAEIMIHGLPVFNGVIELVSVNFKNGLPRTYRVVFYGQSKKALTQWGEKTLIDIDWSAYDHVVNITNVIDSWTGALLGGDILWPIADWHVGYVYSTNFNVKNNINDVKSGAGIHINDLRPLIKLKAMVENIFNQIGYQVSGTLLSDPALDQLFVAPMSGSGPIQNPTNLDAQITASLFALTATAPNYYIGSVRIPLVLASADPLGCWDAAGYFYRVPFNGKYKFKFQTTINSLGGGGGNLKINFAVNGQQRWYGQGTTTLGLYEGILEGDFNAGDKITLIYINSVGFSINNLTFQVLDVPRGINGTTLNIGDLMPPTKISDFLNGFLKAFNAVIIPKGSDEFEIHNIDDWYQIGQTKNWTEYLDISNITHEKTPIPSRVHLMHQEGKDMANERFKEQFVRRFGELNFKPEIDFSADDFEVETIFNISVPSVMRDVDDKGNPIQNTDLQFPVMMDKDSKPIQQAFTLFYYAGIQSCNFHYFFDYIERTTYPLIGPYSAYPTASNSYSLGFGLESVISGSMATKTMFNRWFNPYLSRLFSSSSRIVHIEAILPVGEWINLQMNDTISISGNYYKIEKIDYDMLKEKAKISLLTYPDVDIISLTSSGNVGGWTPASTKPIGETLINGNIIGRDLTNGIPFGGSLQTDQYGQTDFNFSNVAFFKAAVGNIINRLFKTQATGYLDVGPVAYFIPPDGTWVPLAFDQIVFNGASDRFTYDMPTGSIFDQDGGQMRVTAMIAFDHTGNLNLNFAILIDGVPTKIELMTFSDKAPITITGTIEINGGQRIQVACQDLGGVGHPLALMDLKLVVEI